MMLTAFILSFNSHSCILISQTRMIFTFGKLNFTLNLIYAYDIHLWKAFTILFYFTTT